MELPFLIGKYELEEFLGGGMSHVYRAKDTIIGRTVAVKILTPHGDSDPEVKARFLQEARMAGNISHENVVNIYDFGSENGRNFLVMEFLTGKDLRTLMQERRVGDLAAKIDLASQLARALEYVHARKIVHRDLKPENIHVCPDGRLKLMDFGIAKTEGMALTRAGYILGTPYYMAPEQVMGGEVNHLVDIYAFGILFFELITNSKPLSGESVERLFFNILNEPIKLDAVRAVGTPESVALLIQDCTAKKPGGRPQSFASVRTRLTAIAKEIETGPQNVRSHGQSPHESNAAPTLAPVKRRLRMWFGLTGVLLIIFFAVVYRYVGSRNASAPSHPAVTYAEASEPAATESKSIPANLSFPSGDMVLVSAGEALLGERRLPVSIKGFYIDRTEVSNRAYTIYCLQTHAPHALGLVSADPEQPVVNVSFDDAANFAKWAGKRLPTGDEWEKAARGTDGRTFPWGDKYLTGCSNLSTKALAPVRAFPSCASPYGALNMFGNVWEWVRQRKAPGADEFEMLGGVFSDVRPRLSPDEPYYSIRGGSYDKRSTRSEDWRSLMWDAMTLPARVKTADVGFRCAMDIVQ